MSPRKDGKEGRKERKEGKERIPRKIGKKRKEGK